MTDTDSTTPSQDPSSVTDSQQLPKRSAAQWAMLGRFARGSAVRQDVAEFHWTSNGSRANRDHVVYLRHCTGVACLWFHPDHVGQWQLHGFYEVTPYGKSCWEQHAREMGGADVR